MKTVRVCWLMLVLILLVADTGCVRRLPSAAESFGGRDWAEVFPSGELVPLSVPAMIEPGIIPIRHEIGDEQKLLAICFIYWKPCRSLFVPERIYEVTRSVFCDQLFFPVWGEPAGLDEVLEYADRQMNRLVNRQLRAEKLDTVVEIALILVQVSIGETGEARYTWTKGAVTEWK